MLFECAVEPFECLIGVAEGGVNPCDVVGRDKSTSEIGTFLISVLLSKHKEAQK